MGDGMQRAVIASLVALLTVPAYGQTTAKPATEDQPSGVFRSGVDLVTVSATVRDKRGRAVADLTAADFEVLDRGLPRRITEFRTEAAPVSVAILFDVSGSMDVASRSLAAKFAANHVLSWLEHGRDEAALFAFDSRLHEVAPFTVDTRALQGALGEVDPFGATSLHDAIAETARKIHEREQHPPRDHRAHRRHRHRQPADAGGSFGHRQRDRRARLRDRGRASHRQPGRERPSGRPRPRRRWARFESLQRGREASCSTPARRRTRARWPGRSCASCVSSI